MCIIKVENLYKNYTIGKNIVSALKGINLTIKRGEFLAIVGPSGSGKTTLLNIISGLDKPTSGSVYIENKEISKLSYDELAQIRANKIGFIFQNFNLLPVLSAWENVEYPLYNRKISSKERRERAKEALVKVGLSKFLKHRPLELSGGQQQRVAIARAIVGEPSIIFADEPTANLDHQTGEEILGIMKKINRDLNTTFIFSTHDSKIMDMADRVIKLWDGEII